MAPQVEQDFLTFRRSGDSRALARVFDGLAPELLLVAAHLSRDQARAEDLVQDTFLQAIESAKSYDEEQPLRPWLIGILVRKAKMARRREGRAPDRERLGRADAVDPTAQAESVELAESLAETIQSLAMPYRQVLNLHLVHGHAAVDIARILERSPNTVHTQLRRGMEMLRKALPTGFALPAWALVGGRGLAAVRQAVLDGARIAAVSGAAVAAVGGVFAMKKLLVASSVAALAVLVWSQVPDSPAGDPPVDRDVSVVPPLTADSGAVDVEGGEPAGRVPVAASATAAPSESGEDQDFLRGIVLTPDGEPINDAEVKLQQRDTQGFTFLDLEYNDEVRDLATTRSDDEGRFLFRARRFLAYGVQAQARGYAPMALPDCRVGEEYEITLQPAASLQGQVTRADDHSPVAGARLELFNYSGFNAETTSDARGMYGFESVLAGELFLSVYPIAETLIFSRALNIEPGEARRHDVRVKPGAVLRGTVVDSVTGQPIANAEVSASWTFNRSAHTDATGQYVLTGFTGRGITQVTARATGYGRMEQDMPARIAPENTMDFRLMPASAVRGRVLESAGEPAEGVYVAAMGYYQPGPLGGHSDWQSDRTGDDGRYLVTDLRTDLAHALIVRKPGSGMLVYDFPRNPAAGEVLDLGDVILRPGATIEGVVVDGEGRALPGARIELVGNNRDRFRYFEGGSLPDGHISPDAHYLRNRESISGPRGTFSITDLSPGDYEVRAFLKKWAPAVEITIGESGEVRDGITLRVQEGLSIQGRVVTPDGETIPEGIVEMYREDDGRPAGTYFRSGQFEVTGLEPGRYTVGIALMEEAAKSWVGGRVTGVEAGATDVRVVATPTDVIEGIVRDVEGAPVVGISVMARVQEDPQPRTRGPVLTGSDGRFRLRVGVGEIVDVLAGPQLVSERLPPSVVRIPDPALRVTTAGVPAGTRNLVIQLRLFLPLPVLVQQRGLEARQGDPVVLDQNDCHPTPARKPAMWAM